MCLVNIEIDPHGLNYVTYRVGFLYPAQSHSTTGKSQRRNISEVGVQLHEWPETLQLHVCMTVCTNMGESPEGAECCCQARCLMS